MSDAQIETVIYAGEAHAEFWQGVTLLTKPRHSLARLAERRRRKRVQFRKGFFLGDGTGSGKGRQAAGIILDNWLPWTPQGSVDFKIQQADRGRTARLVGARPGKAPHRAAIRYQAGTRRSSFAEGILFTTYATFVIRTRRQESRLKQLLDWLGPDFEGVILFDEAHAMANATGSEASAATRCFPTGKCGTAIATCPAQGPRGLYLGDRRDHRHNLGYAQRLGLWGGTDFPFAKRADFMQAIEAGGIAAMEVLAGDLEGARPLYRALPFV